MKKTIIICDICKTEQMKTSIKILDINLLILSAPILGLAIDFRLSKAQELCSICEDDLIEALRAMVKK